MTMNQINTDDVTTAFDGDIPSRALLSFRREFEAAAAGAAITTLVSVELDSIDKTKQKLYSDNG